VGWDAKVLDLIWGKWEQKYFSENPKYNLTARANHPDGANIIEERTRASQRIDTAHGLAAILRDARLGALLRACEEYRPPARHSGMRPCAGSESILPVVVMDSGLARFTRAPE
jgi:hypothetical protein